MEGPVVESAGPALDDDDKLQPAAQRASSERRPHEEEGGGEENAAHRRRSGELYDTECQSAASPQPSSMGDLWASLPPHLHAKIIVQHSPQGDHRSWRAVSKYWKALVSASVRSLCPQPRPGLPSSGAELASIFPGLRQLDLSRVAMDVSCGKPIQILTGKGSLIYRRQRLGDLRDRPPLPPSAAAASRCVEAMLEGLHCLHLTSLYMESAIGLHEEALTPLSRLDSLEELLIGESEHLTGQGLSVLTPLTALRRLSLSACQALDAKALQAALEPLAGRLQELTIERCRSSGEGLAGAVSSMTNLEHLSLRGSRVRDEELSALKRLYKLQALNLQGLSITSAALRHLQQLTNLKSLNLHGLTQGPSGAMSPLKMLTALETINLRWCEDIMDDDLQDFMPLPHLKDLSLDRCRGLSERGLLLCLEHPALTALSLARCPAVNDAVVEQLGTLKRLITLDLDGCQNFTGATLSFIAAIPTLTTLQLKGCNKIEDEAIAALATASRLRDLDLSWCIQLKGSGVSCLGTLPLERLKLAFCRNLKAIPMPLASLQDLNISGCLQLENASRLGELASLTSLTMEEIDIDGVDKWAKSAGSLTRLTALSLSECELLTNETLKALAALSSLSLLSLRNCDLLGDKDVYYLSSLRRLQVLTLEGLLDLSDDGLVHLYGLPVLQKLCLCGCPAITGEAVRKLISNLPRLKILDLTNCCFLDDDPELMEFAFQADASMMLRQGQHLMGARVHRAAAEYEMQPELHLLERH